MQQQQSELFKSSLNTAQKALLKLYDSPSLFGRKKKILADRFKPPFNNEALSHA